MKISQLALYKICSYLCVCVALYTSVSQMWIEFETKDRSNATVSATKSAFTDRSNATVSATKSAFTENQSNMTTWCMGLVPVCIPTNARACSWNWLYVQARDHGLPRWLSVTAALYICSALLLTLSVIVNFKVSTNLLAYCTLALFCSLLQAVAISMYANKRFHYSDQVHNIRYHHAFYLASVNVVFYGAGSLLGIFVESFCQVKTYPSRRDRSCESESSADLSYEEIETQLKREKREAANAQFLYVRKNSV